MNNDKDKNTINNSKSSDNNTDKNRKDKKYSIGCIVLCFFGFLVFAISKPIREQLGWFWVVVLIILIIALIYSIIEIVNRDLFSKFLQLLKQLWHKTKRLKLIQQDPNSPYQKKPQIVTEVERGFYQLLQAVIKDKYAIYSQVSLASLVDKKISGAFRNELFRTIDFVIADINTSEPIVLIELNDQSHFRQDRVLRDQKIAEICRQAALPLVTFWTTEQLDSAIIKYRLQEWVRL